MSSGSTSVVVMESPLERTSSLAEKYDEYVKKIDQGHVWQGILYPGFLFKPQVLDDIKNFHVRPDDIFIATFPKSGTTWTAELVSLIRSQVNLDYVASVDISERVVHLETPPRFSIQMLEEMKSPRIFGTHLPYHLLPETIRRGACKVIYVMRNPKDVAVSFYHHHRMAKDLGNFDGTFKDFLALFTAGKTVCGSWFDHVLGYWEQTEKDILFLRYEDMKKNLTENIEKLSGYLNVPLSEPQIQTVRHHCTFDVMKQNARANRDWIPLFDKTKGSFMRKGEVGDWKNHFDREDNEAFMRMYEERIGKHTDLKLDFELIEETSIISRSANSDSSLACEFETADFKSHNQTFHTQSTLTRSHINNSRDNRKDIKNSLNVVSTSPTKLPLHPTYYKSPSKNLDSTRDATNFICSNTLVPC